MNPGFGPRVKAQAWSSLRACFIECSRSFRCLGCCSGFDGKYVNLNPGQAKPSNRDLYGSRVRLGILPHLTIIMLLLLLKICKMSPLSPAALLGQRRRVMLNPQLFSISERSRKGALDSRQRPDQDILVFTLKRRCKLAKKLKL